LTPDTVDVLFSGALLPGESRESVQRRLQERLGLTAAQAGQLFSGSPVTVKRGLDPETAARYQALFRSAGALVELYPATPAAEAGAPPDAGAARTPAPVDSGSPPDPNAAQPQPVRLGDTPALSLAPPGATLSTETWSDPPPPGMKGGSVDLQEAGKDWTLEDIPLPKAGSREEDGDS